jgi:hypothetical protein
MAVIVSGLIISVTPVTIDPTTVSQHSHWNGDVTHHQQQRATNQNGKKDRNSTHERPRF